MHSIIWSKLTGIFNIYYSVANNLLKLTLLVNYLKSWHVIFQFWKSKKNFETQSHYVRFLWFYWHFLANLVMHICSMLQVRIIAIWSQGLILNSERSHTTFGTKIPVFRANSGCLLGTKCAKMMDLQKCQYNRENRT